MDSSSEHCSGTPAAYSSTHPAREEKLGELQSLEKDSTEPQAGGNNQRDGGDSAADSTSDASDSANTESRGFKTSGSSDSMDALEEDELEACSSSRPEFFHFYTPTVHEMNSLDKSFFPVCAAGGSGRAEARDFFCFLQVPEAEKHGCKHSPSEQKGADADVSVLGTKLSEGNSMDYYSLCCSISPAGSVERSSISHSRDRSPWRDESAQKDVAWGAEQMAEVSDLILEPPLGFGDTSSEEEFYDAADRLSPPSSLAGKPSPTRCPLPLSSWAGVTPACHVSLLVRIIFQLFILFVSFPKAFAGPLSICSPQAALSQVYFTKLSVSVHTGVRAAALQGDLSSPPSAGSKKKSQVSNEFCILEGLQVSAGLPD